MSRFNFFCLLAVYLFYLLKQSVKMKVTDVRFPAQRNRLLMCGRLPRPFRRRMYLSVCAVRQTVAR